MQQFVDRTTDDKQIKYVIRKYIKFTLLGWFFWWLVYVENWLVVVWWKTSVQVGTLTPTSGTTTPQPGGGRRRQWLGGGGGQAPVLEFGRGIAGALLYSRNEAIS